MSHITITARVKDLDACEVLSQLGAAWGKLERQLFREKHARGTLGRDDANSLKRRWLIEHGLTPSQFNALDVQVKGKMAAMEEGVKLACEGLKTKIGRVERDLKKCLSAEVRHQKNRRLARLRARLVNLKDRKKTALCFGSRKLFRAQFNLKENGFRSHGEWLVVWQAAMASQTFCLGSKAERSGNASCTMMAWGGTAGELRVRQFGPGQEKFAMVPIRFSYQAEHMDAAMRNHLPVSYRLCEAHGKWYVHATMERCEVPIQTSSQNGYLGVDLNIGHVSCARISPDGNLASIEDLSFGFEKRESSNQRQAKIFLLAVKLVENAVEHKTPIVIEKLDFQGKKKELKSRGLNEMLSSFAYMAFHNAVLSRAQKNGVEVITVNPAYTSQIGFWKFAQGKGLTVHQGAAFCIARRSGTTFSKKSQKGKDVFVAHTKFSERLVVHPFKNTFELPVRNRSQHVWTEWRKLESPRKWLGRKVTVGERVESPRGRARKLAPLSRPNRAIQGRRQAVRTDPSRKCSRTGESEINSEVSNSPPQKVANSLLY